MPTRYADIYRSDYLAPEDIPPEGLRGVQFFKAEERELNCAGARPAWKLVLWAKTSDGKPMKRLIAVNKTSAKQLCKAWGKPLETYAIWLGKLADLTHVQIKAFGAMKDAVLITPVMKPTEASGESFKEASEAPPQKAESIKPPQKKSEPAKQTEPAPPPVETVNEETGEVFQGEEAQDEPLDELMITDVKSSDKKRPDGSPYTIWFITASDGRVYFSTKEEDGNMATLRMQDKQGALIQTGEPTVNKGKSYFPIVKIS